MVAALSCKGERPDPAEEIVINSTMQLDVETYYLDQDTMCGLLPFTVGWIAMPGVPSKGSSFASAELGGFSCREPVVKFEF